MKYDSSYYEEEFLDNDEPVFKKISQKSGKTTKQDKKSAIRAKRKEKMRQQETSDHKEIFILEQDYD